MKPRQEDLFKAKKNDKQCKIECNGEGFLYQLWLIKKDNRIVLWVECGKRNSEYTIEYSEPNEL